MEIVLLALVPLLAVGVLAFARGFSTRRQKPLDWNPPGSGPSRAADWPPHDTLVRMVRERAVQLEIEVAPDYQNWDREQLEQWLMDHGPEDQA